jgi:acyl transferase domain-containing protein
LTSTNTYSRENKLEDHVWHRLGREASRHRTRRRERALVAKRRIAETVEGFNELLSTLAEAGETAGDPIPVAIETPRGLLVAVLRATGRKVSSINPMASRCC